MSARARQHRAAVAARLLAGAPQAAATLDWAALDAAPAWLALDDESLISFQCRVGAVLCSRALRLWIDGSRLAAAQAVLGAPFLHSLLGEPEDASIPLDPQACPQIHAPAQVAPVLRIAGVSVLLATLPEGPLCEAARASFAPITPSTLPSALARRLVARAESLQRLAITPVRSAPMSEAAA